MKPVEPAPWQSPKILTTLVLVFLAGATTGAVSMRYGLHEHIHPTASANAKEPGRDVVLQRFRAELDLSPQQAEKIGLVLEDYSRYYQSLQDQLDDIRATGKTRIVQILDPAQRDKFEKMMGDLAPQLAPKP